MRTADRVQQAVLLDRLAILDEVQSIEDALTRIERQYGSVLELEAARRRAHNVRSVVLAQLRFFDERRRKP